MTAGTGMRPPAAGLQATIDTYRAALTSLGTLGEWRLDGFDRTGVPVMAAVWTDPDDPAAAILGVGYGWTWPEAAVGALGELAERVVLRHALGRAPVITASYAALSWTHGPNHVADPLTLTLPAGSEYHPDRPLDWVAAARWRTHEAVLVPIEFAAADGAALAPGYQPLITPISNGLGAGDTAERAVSHALLELLQRDGDTVSFRALDQGAEIDLAGLTDERGLAVLDRLRAAGINPMVKLASTEYVTVVYAVGDDPTPHDTPLAISAIGEAAHPDPQTAVTKALLEFASSRARRAFGFGPLDAVARRLPDYLEQCLRTPVGAQEERALHEMTEWAAMSPEELRDVAAPNLFRRSTLIDLGELPPAPDEHLDDPAALLRHLDHLLAEFDILVVGAEHNGIHSVKVLAPGLEVETLSYLRIGERVTRRLLDRDSPLVGLGTPDRPGRLPIRLTAAATERLGGPAWLDRTEVDRTIGRLYPLYREPGRHANRRLPLDHVQIATHATQGEHNAPVP